MEPTLDQRFTEVRQRAGEALARSGRAGSPLYVVAVTKYAEPDDIRHLIELGHRDFGESRVQQLVQRASVVREWFDRVRMLPETVSASDRIAAGRLAGIETSGKSIDVDQPVRWHMIGHLQRNKARKVAEFCRLVHSVDSLRLIEELQGWAHRRDETIDVLIQVNIAGEEQKSGCPISAVAALGEQIDTMVHVRVRGLMTMAPLTDDERVIRSTFSRCRELFEELQRDGVGAGHFNLLSMGMSGDYEIAIEEGANIVRVGSAIFGERQLEEMHAGD